MNYYIVKMADIRGGAIWITVTVVRNGVGEPGSNSGCGFYFCSNIIGNCMNPIVFRQPGKLYRIPFVVYILSKDKNSSQIVDVAILLVNRPKVKESEAILKGH